MLDRVQNDVEKVIGEIGNCVPAQIYAVMAVLVIAYLVALILSKKGRRELEVNHIGFVDIAFLVVHLFIMLLLLIIACKSNMGWISWVAILAPVVYSLLKMMFKKDCPNCF